MTERAGKSKPRKEGALYDVAPAGYLTLDREGAIRQVNLAGASLLGDERSRLVNRRFGLFVAEGGRRTFSDFLQKVFASQAKECCEVTLPQEGSQPVVVQIEGTRSADGQECRAVVLDITARRQAEERARAAHAEIQRLLDLSEQSRMVLLSMAEDALEARRKTEQTNADLQLEITERKLAEEAREKLEAQLRQSQKMETVGRLAGGVAHDFNNVLTGIIGYAEFVQGYLGENAAARKDIAQILSLTQRAAGITQQLLAFARRQTLQLAVCNINISLRNVGELLSPLIGEDVDLKFFPAPDLGNVQADAGQIGQVLVNLAVNARDAMPDGGKLTIETANASLDQTYADTHLEVKPGEYVMIAVTDTGCGMDEATRARLFEPFFTTKDEGKGTGLGLATAYGIVKQHGGHIHVYSEPGNGTCFKIYLPRVCDAVKQATSPAAAPIAERGEGVVLVVDDEASICNIIARILTENGYKVVAATSPGEAQEQFAAHQQDIRLLLTDVVLPGANGRELYEQCVKLRPSLRVLYMSGYTDNAIAHRGVLDAGTSFIGKPFTSAELLRKVRQVLAS